MSPAMYHRGAGGGAAGRISCCMSPPAGTSPAGDGVDGSRGFTHPGSVRHADASDFRPLCAEGLDDVRNDKEASSDCRLSGRPRWRRTSDAKADLAPHHRGDHRLHSPLRRGWPRHGRPGPGPPPFLTDRYTVTVRDILHLDSPTSSREEWQVIARHVFESKATMTASYHTRDGHDGLYRLGAVLHATGHLHPSGPLTGAQPH